MKPQTHQFAKSTALVLCAFGIIAPNTLAQQAPAKKPSTVLVQKTVVIESAVSKSYIGLVEAIDHVTVQPRVSGNIVATKFKEGQYVNKGDLLFEIEDTLYKAAEAEALAKKAEFEAKLLYAKNSFTRYNKLLTTNSVSKDTVENAKSTMHALEASTRSAQASLIVAQDNLKYTKITAPISGKTGRVTYSTGNYITPSAGSLVTITGTNEMYVKFPLSERDYLSLFGTEAKLKKDAIIELLLANGTNYEHRGQVVMLDNTIQTTTDTINVWAKFPNPENKLKHGGVVTVNLSKANVAKYPSANISAVMHDALTSYVYVVNAEGKVERRDVKLGNTVENQQCFKDGVKDGEIIIIDGMHKVKPGAKVTTVYTAK